MKTKFSMQLASNQSRSLFSGLATGGVSLLATSILYCPTANAALVNGNFESGLSGWTVVDEAGSSGSWYSQSGTGSPTSGFSVSAPPSGTFAAMTDQSGPGSHILYQDISLAGNSTNTLTFSYYIKNTTTFSQPNSLSSSTFPNQQFRVDVLNPNSSDLFGTSTAGVLTNIFQATANTTNYQTLSFDLTPFAGSTIRLAFREVDNQGNFNTGIDNVIINSTASTAVPEPFTIIGTLIGGTAALRMKKKLKPITSKS
jgi:hypothetical protein